MISLCEWLLGMPAGQEGIIIYFERQGTDKKKINL